MKRSLASLTVCFLALITQAQNNVTIHARLKGLAPGKWVHYREQGGKDKRDSVLTVAGGFTLTIDIPEGEGDTYLITIERDFDNPWSYITPFLTNGIVNIEGKGPLFKDVRLSGSHFVSEWNDYNDFINASPGMKELFKKNNELAYKKDTAGLRRLWPSIDSALAVRKDRSRQWILAHPASQISMYALALEFNDMKELEPLLKGLTAEAKNNVPGRRIETEIKNERLLGIGQTAPSFSQTDTAGKTISLSDFRGKYVLVDFWASWCVPCREENPNVVKAFKKFRNRDFTVLGVSLDQPGGKEKWLKAIHDDGLTWTHISDLKWWSNAVSVLYNIQSVPANYLIGPDGKIIAKDLHGDELEKKLGEVLPARTTAGQFSIDGTLTGYRGSLVYLLRYDDRKMIVDSATVDNGKFHFAGPIDGAMRAFLSAARMLPRENGDYREFLLEPSPIRITATIGDLKHATVEGSSAEDDQAVLNKAIQPILDDEKDLNAEYEASNKRYMEAVSAHLPDKTIDSMHEAGAALHDKFEPYQKRTMTVMQEFIVTHPDSYVSAMQLQYFVQSLPLDTTKALFAGLSPEIQKSKNGQTIQKGIDKIAAGSPGSAATDFTAAELNGKPLILSSFKGKSCVIIDFWASWCVPCRHSNPHMKELYKKYHDKGLEVIGVSDDDGKPDAWKKAVTQDGVDIWHNVLRGLDWDKFNKGELNDKDINEKFGIHSLPTKILIDRNGMIIGRYGEGREDEASMDRKLEEIFL